MFFLLEDPIETVKLEEEREALQSAAVHMEMQSVGLFERYREARERLNDPVCKLDRIREHREEAAERAERLWQDSKRKAERLLRLLERLTETLDRK
jgi:Rad3-related DNA helicase